MLAALLLAAAATAAPAPVADVTVCRDGERWTADYHLRRRANAWAFTKSALPRETRRPCKDGEVNRGGWLALLQRRAGNNRSAAAVSELLDHAQADPAAALDRFIAATGIADDFPATTKATV